MKAILRVALAAIVLPFLPPGARADVGAGQQVAIESQIQQRVFAIVGKADKQAIVHVKIAVKRMSSDLPGVWTQAKEVTPVTGDGALSVDGIEKIEVRVVTQVDELPAWVKDEAKRAIAFDKVKVELKYEKAKGKFAPDGKIDSVTDTLKDVSKDLINGVVKSGEGAGRQVSTALWGVAGGVVVTVMLLCVAIFMLGRRIESAFFKVVDEKLAPLLQAQAAAAARQSRAQSRGTGNDAGGAKPGAQAAAATGGSAGANEFSDLSANAVFALVVDCYWTHSDAYAHYVWTKLSAKQRDELLANRDFGPELYRYFQFVRQFAPENLGYAQDVQYVEANSSFARVSQAELAKFVAENPAKASSITPLRWDKLPISLSDRLKATLAMNESQEQAPIQAVPLKASKWRELPRRLEVKSMTDEDEAFLWQNPDSVHPSLRGSLKTLVWLALAPLAARERILGEVDARDLAEAWVGPEPALEKIKEGVSPKKFEMIKSYLKETQPDRNSAVYETLAAQGAEALNEEALAGAEAPLAKERAA